MITQSYLTLSLACSVVFVDLLAYGVIIPLLPVYAQTLGATSGQVGLLFASYWIAFFFTLIPFGLMVDRYGTKKMVVGGMFLLFLCSALYALSSSMILLAISRTLQGVAAACNWSAALPLAVQSTNFSKRGLELSSVSLSIGLGTIVGPILGGLGSVQTALFLCAALAFFLTMLCLFFFPEGQQKEISLEGKLSRLLRQENLRVACLAVALAYLGFGMVESLFPLHMAGLQYSRAEIGMLFGVQGITFAIAQPLAGAWSDRKGRVLPMALGLLTIAFLLPLPFFFRSLSVWGLLFALFGVAIAAAFAPSIPLIADGVDPADQGSAYALYNSIISIGFILGPWLGGRMAEVKGIRTPFLLAALVLASGALIVLWMGRRIGLPSPIPPEKFP